MMSSNSIDGLQEKIRRIQRRRARRLVLREISLGIVLLTVLFAGLGVLEMIFQFTPGARGALTGILAAAAAAVGWRCVHIYRQAGRAAGRIAHYIDEHLPELEQRLITSLEFGAKQTGPGSAALVERLWEDTSLRLQDLDLVRVAAIRHTRVAAAAALLLLCGLFYAGLHVNEFSSAGLRVMLPWIPAQAGAARPVGLSVAPGTIKIQRGNDVMLIARIANAIPDRVDVLLQTDSADWRPVPMTREGAQNSYVYLLPGVKKDVNYYVDIGVKRSAQHRISVFDMPRVERIEVNYAYPEYTGMGMRTVKDGGDVIAPEGTRITLQAHFNKAVAKAVVHFSDGTTLDLAAAGAGRTRASGAFIVAKDLTYTLNVIDTEQLQNEDPYEYVVRSVPDDPPAVRLVRPGRDRRVMSLEEVAIAAAAEDDYGLAGFALNYRVAGGQDREIDFLAPPNGQLPGSVNGKTTLYLEDLGVNPGDFIFYFLTARDNNHLQGAAEVVSDIYFLEVVPTDEAFRRASQQAGGGGGAGSGGRSASALVENQKQIIAATWKLLRQRKQMGPDGFEEKIETITEAQRQIMQRTRLSLRRLAERLAFADGSYQRAVEHLSQAVSRMEAAVEKLTARQLAEALGPEQSALQAIMKAESESRNTTIQMARNQGGGGAGGSDREREDLKALFEMEMGRLENRYEIPQRGAGAARDQERDDTLEKLRDIARRQERLNRGQDDFARRQERLSAEQRKRRLEELRREQEELRRQAQELSRQMSQLGRQNGLRQWSDRQRQLADAARQMQEAEGSLRRQDTGSALSRGRQVLESLRKQEREMRLDRQATVSNLIDALRRKAQALQQQERRILQKLQALNDREDGESPEAKPRALRETADLLAAKEQMLQELGDAEAMLKSIGRKGQADQPDIADRAREALRALATEGIKGRIKESQEMLEAGWLSLSMGAEKEIEQSLERVSERLRNLDRPAAPSREEQIRQAAADAGGLRRELENLQKEIEALKKSNAGQRRRLTDPGRQTDNRMGRAPADGDESTRERMQQHLQRSRRHARGLVQPWAQGERWGIDARSIQRELSRREIEDFLSQPDLWQKLLAPARELESTLQAAAEDRQLRKSFFSMPDDTVPTPYRDAVDAYYRELSQVERENTR